MMELVWPDSVVPQLSLTLASMAAPEPRFMDAGGATEKTKLAGGPWLTVMASEQAKVSPDEVALK